MESSNNSSFLISERVEKALPEIKEATVQKWLVKEGDTVEQFQDLAEVSTDKLFTQIPATEEGKIHKIHIEEGNACQVGSILLELEVEEDEASSSQPSTATPSKASDQSTIKTEAKPASSSVKRASGEKVLSTPSVRAFAKSVKVDINNVQGSGADGRVTKEDVENFMNKGGAPSHSPHIEVGVDIYQDLLATPAVRSFAKEHGVDINQVSGSGQHGRILKEDILAFKESPTKAKSTKQAPSAPGLSAYETVKMNNIMTGMVKSMNHAATVPHFYLNDEFDITKLSELRARVNEGAEKKDRIAIFSFVLKAFSIALKDFPQLNSTYSDDRPYEYRINEEHNVSVAIDTPNGLMAPNLKSCQNKSIREIQQELHVLRGLAEAGRIGQNELFGGTIALSNIGSIGGTYASPLNLPEQVCIVALGRTKDVPSAFNPVQVDGKTLYDVQMRKVVSFELYR